MATKFCQQVSPWILDLLLFVIALPFSIVIGLARLARRISFARLCRQRALLCRTCCGEVLLVGFWRCGCGFTYRGHLLRLCPVCGALPQLIRCEHCGATETVRR